MIKTKLKAKKLTLVKLLRFKVNLLVWNGSGVMFSKLIKRLRNIARARTEHHKVAKNSPKRGRSMRNGNMPSPYTKYNKKPYVYSFKSKKASEFRQASW